LIRQIVCALDVLRPSRAAVRHAFEIAVRYNALLDVLYARPPSSTKLTGLGTQPDSPVDANDKLRELIGSVATPIRGRASVHVIAGPAVPAILEYATRTRCDLIVLGSSPDEIPSEQRARVADRVAARARCAVMTSNEWTWADPPGLGRILLPVRSAPFAPSRVAEWVATLGWHFDSSVELLHVTPQGQDGPAQAIAADRARVHMADWKAYLNGRGVRVSHTSVIDGLTAPRIAERAELTRADLIAMEAGSGQGEADDLAAQVRRNSGTRVLSVRRDPD
jgi:nucleotide-binding universal stress UspA family protein